MRCPQCKNSVLQKSGSRIRLRTHGPIDFEDGLCKAKCYWCKSAIEMELEVITKAEVGSESFTINGNSFRRRRPK